MAHMVAPLSANPELPVFFNVDGVVGAMPAENRREDVLLVQFIFHLLGQKPSDGMSAEQIATARAVTMTGIADAPTIAAIRMMQEQTRTVAPAVVVDSRVSPVQGGVYRYAAGTPWTIVTLNNLMQDRNLDTWPRIDMISGCPGELKDMVKRAVVGN